MSQSAVFHPGVEKGTSDAACDSECIDAEVLQLNFAVEAGFALEPSSAVSLALLLWGRKGVVH